MAIFERIGPYVLDQKGITKETIIRLSNQSFISIQGDMEGYNFKLKFSNGDNNGWLVDRQALGELIAELLYIRREVVGYWGEEVRPPVEGDRVFDAAHFGEAANPNDDADFA